MRVTITLTTDEIKKLQKKLKITTEDKFDIVYAIHEFISRL